VGQIFIQDSVTDTRIGVAVDLHIPQRAAGGAVGYHQCLADHQPCRKCQLIVINQRVNGHAVTPGNGIKAVARAHDIDLHAHHPFETILFGSSRVCYLFGRNK
jgi:hypothetical protein